MLIHQNHSNIVETDDSEFYVLRKLAGNLPHRSEEVMPGIQWGDCAQPYTPAFWKFQYNLHGSSLREEINYRLGETIIEEISACILGGFGIPSEIGIMAFNRLKDEGLIRHKVSKSELFEALSRPFILSNGKSIKYRFYNQKSTYLFSLLQRDDLSAIPVKNGKNLRNWLLKIDGIGYKTASWIARNWLGCDEVAILDIHIIRAGILVGFYNKGADVSKNYLSMEDGYLQFCNALNVNASKMDAIIWDFMKKTNRFAINILKN